MRYNIGLVKKILLAMLLGMAAASAFYWVTEHTFKKINSAVNELSEPVEKISAMNRLLTSINNSDQWVREVITTGKTASLDRFKQQTVMLVALTDTLKMLSADDSMQLKLMDSVVYLLKRRAERLNEYYQFRANIGFNTNLEENIEAINTIITPDSTQPNMIIYSDREKTSVTRIDTIEESKKTGFFNKLFSRKKQPTIVTVQEEASNEQVDTLFISTDRQQLQNAQNIIQNITKSNQVELNQIRQKETAFNNAEKLFTQKINNLIRSIEQDINDRTVDLQFYAKDAIQKNISILTYVLIGFLSATLILIIMIMIDISKSNRYKKLLELARDEAEQQSISKQTLLSNMSHELRTPLQAIVGYTEQAVQADAGNSHLQSIQKASDHLLQVVNEVLEYSSIHSGKFSYNLQAFNPKSIVEAVEDVVSIQVAQKNLHFIIHQPKEKAPLVTGDAFRLQQILMNLLGNAIKYTPAGTITLAYHFTQIDEMIYYTFEVADTGPGIPVEMQDKIFDQFEQVSTSIEQRRTGTGLGLSITRALVQGQGGTIMLKSTPGKGSTFSFTIPYPIVKQPDQIVQTKKSEVRTHFNGEVWLIDDDDLIIQLYKLILTKHKIRHTCFAHVNDILEAAKTSRPHIVISDMRMPEKSGIELFEALTRLWKDPVYKIACTAHALPDEKNAILRKGIDDILTKPFKEADLISILETATLKLQLPTDLSPKNQEVTTDTKMAGDDNGMELIQKHFAQETKKDIAQLEAYMQENDTVAIAETLHKLAGRISQLGYSTLGLQARKMEINIRKNNNKFSNTILQKWIERVHTTFFE